MAPRVPTKAGGVPDGVGASGAGGHAAGGIACARSESARVGTCYRQEREANNTGWGACEEVAVTANTEWSGQTHGAV